MGTSHVGLPVAGLGGKRAVGRCGPGHPADLIGGEGARLQPRMRMPLHDIQRIVCDVFARDVPRVVVASGVGAGLNTANANALALT